MCKEASLKAAQTIENRIAAPSGRLADPDPAAQIYKRSGWGTVKAGDNDFRS
jgi:hypothetical protein